MRSDCFSDAELMNGLISMDERILKQFYVIYFQRIRRYVFANNGNDEDARDLFQDVLMVLFQKVREGRFRLTCALGTYLYSVARFLWLKELSQRKVIKHQLRECEDFIDMDADIDTISEKNERMKLYHCHFEQLSENCRKVLMLFSEGYSIAEITTMMGFKSEQHTRNRRYRCKMALIRNIRQEWGTNNSGYGNNKID